MDLTKSYLLLPAAYLVLFWLFGAIPGKNWRRESISAMCLTGFLIYFSLFHLIAFPMKVMKLSLSLLLKVWVGIVAVSLLFLLIFRFKALWNSVKNFFSEKEKALLSLGLMIVTIGFAWYISMNYNNISAYDAAHYIGYPSASVYSDTLEKISVYTGRLLSKPNGFYVMNTEMLHSAVVSRITGIHPLAERQFSFSFTMICLFEMSLYCCGKHLLKKEHFKQFLFMILANLILYFSFSYSGVSMYFAYRTYEGKSVVAYFYTALIFYFALIFYREKAEKRAYLGLALCGLSGICFCNTALFLVPFEIGCTMFPFCVIDGIKDRTLRYIAGLVLVLIPCVFWLGVYMIV